MVKVIKSFGLYSIYKYVYRTYHSSEKCLRNISNKDSYYHRIGKHPLVYRTIGQQLDLAAKRFSDCDAVISHYEKTRFTFAQVLEKADDLAANLIKIGLKKGDHLGIWLPNSFYWYIIFMAAARAGIVSVALNPALGETEIEYCIKKVRLNAIVAQESFKTQHYYDMLKKIVPELKNSLPGSIQSLTVPHLRTVIIHSANNLPGTFKLDDIMNYSDIDIRFQMKESRHSIQPDDPVNIQFTSGTTGSPKATLLSHYSLVNNGISTAIRSNFHKVRTTICCQVPLFHAFGLAAGIMTALSYGSTLVLPSPSFDPVKSLEAIVEEKCTTIYGTPTMYIDLIKKQKEINLPIKTLKVALIGAAPCSPQLIHDMKTYLDLVSIKNGFGMTEVTGVAFQSLQNESENNLLHTIGHLGDHIEAKVVDPSGNIVPMGTPGELYLRGYLTCLEYFDDEKKTKELIGKDKWLKTGDQVILQENGFARIVGRLKEMIIRGGENIFPKEIEDFLNTHPDVIESQVIGVYDNRMGEEICAYLRLRQGITSLTQSEVKEFCTGNIAHFKIPRYIKIIGEFPKTSTGKIKKSELLKIFVAEKTSNLRQKSKLLNL